jgi:Flp pilus assembly pilin Flp
MRRDRHRKGQSAVEYAFVIALVALVFISMQAHIARGMRGQIQAGTDQLADQYAYGLTYLYEHNTNSSSNVEVNTPGFNHPNTITTVGGHQLSTSLKGVRPLDETWPPTYDVDDPELIEPEVIE